MSDAQLVVDTSAMIAVLRDEDGHERLKKTLTQTAFVVPAPVLVEFWRVARRDNILSAARVSDFLTVLLEDAHVVSFSADFATAATEAAEIYGTGNGRGGTLNLLDLMVYGTASILRLPILCVGKDFAATDAMIHPASRIG